MSAGVVAVLALPTLASARESDRGGVDGSDRPNRVVTYTFKGQVARVNVSREILLVSVEHANRHGRRFNGRETRFDLSDAQLIGADFNGDGRHDLADVVAGDGIAIQVRMRRKRMQRRLGKAKLGTLTARRAVVTREPGQNGAQENGSGDSDPGEDSTPGQIPPSPSPRGPLSLLFDGRFESVGLNSWPGVVNLKSGHANMLTYQTAIRRRNTGYAAKLEVGGLSGLGERIEFGPLNLWDNDMEGRELWIAFSHQTPAGQVLPDRIVYSQRNSKHQAQNCESSGSGFADGIQMYHPTDGYPADRWQFNTSGGRDGCTQKTWQIPSLGDVRDVWIDWLVHYRFHSLSSDGPITELFYRVGNGTWVNPVSDTTQPNLVRALDYEGSFRWEGGLYKGEGYTPYTTAYFGGMVIAPTRADAEAAMFD